MTKNLLFIGCLFVSLWMMTSSCKKDESPATPQPTENVTSFFEVQNGVFKNASFPSATSDVELNNVQMNNKVISGGTSYVSFETPIAIDKILVGVKDIDGYFEIAPSDSREIIYNFILIMAQAMNEQFFVVQIAVLDENGQVSQSYFVSVELITAGTGQLQISLSFDNEKDVDLHLIEPNGSHIYYGDKRSANGGELDVDSNPSCNIDSINNENIFYSDSAFVEPGIYSVYVDMYENCDPSIPTNFVLSVFYDGILVQTVTGNNPVAGIFPVDEPSNYGSLSDLEPVITFEIQNVNAKQPLKKFEPLPLTESAILKLNSKKN
ncbi:MAG: hypothetical protein PHR53_03055 [Bacteroidales bacterium]|nr:hypothetical protein [Bacteroidales bacterium]